MNLKELTVLLYGRQVGIVEETRGGQHVLTYADDPGNTPVSLSMPLGLRQHKNRVVQPYLDGLLPDRDETRQAIGREFGVTGRNPFALLSHIGLDCAGAVQFVDPGLVAETLVRPGELIDVSPEQIGARLGSLTSGAQESWVSPAERWSLAGGQAKFALHRRQDGSWAQALGSTPTTHIIKPGIDGLRDQALNEHVCLASAKLVGLAAAATEFTEFDGHPAIVVERYDRLRRPDGELLRVHQEDLCQALSIAPENKYEADGGPRSATVLHLLAAHATADDRWGFVQSQVFNYLIGGTDAHGKNLSLLLIGRTVQVAPLYDVASGFPYEGLAMELPMAVAGERRFGFVRDRHWAAFATQADIPADRVIASVRAMADALPDAVADVLNAVEAHGASAARLRERLLPGVAEQCRRSASGAS